MRPRQPYQAILTMEADVFGPSRCVSQFASLGVLPRSFHMCKTDENEVMVTLVFEPHEDPKRLERAVAKLSALPSMYEDRCYFSEADGDACSPI